MARKKSVARADRPRPSKALRALERARPGGGGLAGVPLARPQRVRRPRASQLEGHEAHAPAPRRARRVVSGPSGPRLRHRPRPHRGQGGPGRSGRPPLLGVCVPDPASLLVPPGIGLAWLRLDTQGLDPPVAPARLVHLALHVPQNFLQGVTEDELSPGPPDPGKPGGDRSVGPACPDRRRRSRPHLRAPLRLFNELMAADWITTEVSGSSPGTAGMLSRSPAVPGARQGLPDSIQEDPESMSRSR